MDGTGQGEATGPWGTTSSSAQLQSAHLAGSSLESVLLQQGAGWSCPARHWTYFCVCRPCLRWQPDLGRACLCFFGRRFRLAGLPGVAEELALDVKRLWLRCGLVSCAADTLEWALSELLAAGYSCSWLGRVFGVLGPAAAVTAMLGCC